MTLPVPIPYGLRQVRVTPYTDASATALSATSVSLPYARTFSFTESVESNQLRGDDRVVADHASAPTVEWELEAGGLSFEAAEVMFGLSIIEAGVTPNRTRTLRRMIDDERPWFKVEGRSISDSGGDLHLVVYKAKATGEITGNMRDNEFFVTNASGSGLESLVPSTLGRVWDFVQNETATAVV